MADVANFFKHTLPSLAAGVASGVPGPIGAVAQIISKVLDKPIKADPDAIGAAIAGATPDQILKLKEDDQQFQVTMQKLGFDDAEALYSIEEKDRADARNREVQVKDKTNRNIAYLVLGMVCSGEGFLLVHGAPKTVPGELIGRIMGTLDNALMLMLAYYYGTSRGSDAKNEIINNLSK